MATMNPARIRARRLPLDLKGLTGREEIFRVAVGKKRDPAVERWFAGDPAELRTIAAEWFARIRDCGDDVLELVHDGCPIACIEDAPFAYVNAFKSLKVPDRNGQKHDGLADGAFREIAMRVAEDGGF